MQKIVMSFLFKAMVLGVLAEHSLPFTMSPVLIQLSKALSDDPKALQLLSMDRTSASYKMRFGLGETFLNKTLKNISECPYSLNMDESTSNNLMRVLCILVSYYCNDSQQVVVEHLASISVIKVDTKSLHKELVDLFAKYNIPWKNLTSVLMDSCSVMRGSKNGLEVTLRKHQASHMLDIDGDTCHHIHNATKKFCSVFESKIECLLGVLYNDFKWSTDLREALGEICMILGIKYTMPERFIMHRWLSSYDVSVSTLRLMNPYLVFYYSFLPHDTKGDYTDIVEGIYNASSLSPESRDRIKEIQEVLSKKKMTDEGKERKKKVIERIFYTSLETNLILNFYVAVLPMLKSYVCLFELKEPMIHKLHDEQLKLFTEFLACFVKQEVLAKNKTGKKLKALEIKEEILLKKTHMFIGHGTQTVIKKHKHDTGDFLNLVASAYTKCAQHMQLRLPINSRLLRCISAIDPLARGNDITITHLKPLPDLITNVLTEEEKESYAREIYRYQVDNLPPRLTKSGGEVRLDVWWTSVFNTQKYPSLSKIVKAIMSCFHGPQVEGSFNVMGDVMDEKSGRMNVETYSSIQTVKYGMRATNKSAIQLFQRKDILHDPVDKILCNNIQSSYKRYDAQCKEQQKELDQRKQELALKDTELQSKRAAKELLAKQEKEARMAHKRKLERSLAELAKRRKLKK